MVCDAGYLRESIEQEIFRVCTDCVLRISWFVMQAILGSPLNNKNLSSLHRLCIDTFMVCDAGYLRESLEKEIFRVCKDCVLISLRSV